MGHLLAEQMDTLLRGAEVGRLACQGDAHPYVVPIAFVYDGESLYAHSWEGQKVALMRQNPAVSFQVDRILSLTQWQSVLVEGTFEELAGQEAEEALRKLYTRLAPLAPGRHSRPGWTLIGAARKDLHGRQEVVFRIRVLRMTGRYETH
ncbi:hypothetical protein SAMN05421823_106174 [Catalinimonas alkaloidigena]|uniref:Pyridoxamine 5'-phosphate oxidase n=1 Tax=Catalinimonas alkaloidigena TaxID=1075417 RepID=A0A1G9KJB6_9BACT|nr:pyridoxamine 5'-phosphate oxidase family protein [Catalinimonas alkaloidigena]SDL49597.1 hypothetical protein SAMN05421823_106174 [Catalinimonas alkaloidigena]